MTQAGLRYDIPQGYSQNLITGELTKNINLMSDAEFNDYFNQQAKNQSRTDRLNQLFGNTSSTNNLGIGANNSTSANGSSTSNSGLSIAGIGGIEDMAKQAKDLAQFRLGLDFQQMDKSAALREQESANNFGRTTKLTDQTYNWQRLINQDTQGAQTQRNTDTLNTQKEMQNTDINQQNFNTRRAIGLASRRLGG